MYNLALQARGARSTRWLRSGLLAGLLLLLVLPSPNVSADTFGGEELKDPTRPAGAALVEAEGEGFLAGLFGTATGLVNNNYKVTFIRAGGSESVAMINDRLVSTGDMIGEAEVVAIDAQSVSLRVNGVLQRVTSYNDTVKTLAQPE